MLEPRDRRLLVAIAVCTAAIAVLLLAGVVLSFVLATHGGSSGTVTVLTVTRPTP